MTFGKDPAKPASRLSTLGDVQALQWSRNHNPLEGNAAEPFWPFLSFLILFFFLLLKLAPKFIEQKATTAAECSICFTDSLWHQIISRTFNTCVAGLTTESSNFFICIMHIYFLLIFPQYYNIVHIQPPDGIIAYISWNA